MSKEEMIDKIFEMSKEIILLSNASLEDIKSLYVQTKMMLETYKEVNGDKNE